MVSADLEYPFIVQDYGQFLHLAFVIESLLQQTEIFLISRDSKIRSEKANYIDHWLHQISLMKYRQDLQLLFPVFILIIFSAEGLNAFRAAYQC